MSNSESDTALTVRGEYVTVETSANDEEGSMDRYGVVVDYKLNKQSKVYGVLAQTKADEDFGFAEDKETVVGLGMEVKF